MKIITVDNCNCKDTNFPMCETNIENQTHKYNTNSYGEAVMFYRSLRLKSNKEQSEFYTTEKTAQHLYFAVHYKDKHVINISRG